MVQTQVGPSELGGCRRKVWYRLNDQPETNENELKLAAIMGTAIHATIEEAIRSIDPKGEKYWVETAVEYSGMKAHIDLFIPETGDVIDWKTVKKQNLSYFPSEQQRWQVQVYGYLISKSGLGKVQNVNYQTQLYAKAVEFRNALATQTPPTLQGEDSDALAQVVPQTSEEWAQADTSLDRLAALYAEKQYESKLLDQELQNLAIMKLAHKPR